MLVAALVTALVFADSSYGALRTWRPGTDSGIFLATAWHLLNGRWLYEDIFDNKPPVVFLLNAAALWLGDGDWRAMRIMELASMVASSFFLYRLILAFGVERWIAIGTALLLVLVVFQPGLIQGGNTTEQYGLMLLLCGAWLAIRSLTATANTLALAFAAGVTLGCAPLAKEPFALSVLPWVALAAVAMLLNRRYKGFAALSAGVLTPLLLWMLTYAAAGRAEYLLDYFSFNFGYVSSASAANSSDRWFLNLREAHWRLYSVSRSLEVLAVFGLSASVFALIRFRRQERAKVWGAAAVLAAVLCDFAGTGISQHRFGHYYVQAGGMFLLASALGLQAIRDAWMAGAVKRYWLIPVILTCIGFDSAFVQSVASRAGTAQWALPRTTMAAYVVEQFPNGASMWVTSNKWSYLYVESRALSPTRFAYVADLILVSSATGTGEDKLREVAAALHSKPPDFIVFVELDNRRFLGAEMRAWIDRNYADTGIKDTNAFGTARLLARRVPV